MNTFTKNSISHIITFFASSGTQTRSGIQAKLNETLESGKPLLTEFKEKKRFHDMLASCNTESREENYEWILWWKENYKQLSDTIRLLKQYRKPEILRRHTNDIFSAQSEIQYTLHRLRLLATDMLEYRVENKELRKEYVATQRNEREKELEHAVA